MEATKTGTAGTAATEQAAKKPQNVWKVNPLTSRPSSQASPTPNGVSSTTSPKPTQPKPSADVKKESATADRHANDRLTFLLANFTGLQCTITVRNGEQYTGVFSGSSLDAPEARYVLKMVKRAQPSDSQQTNGANEGGDEYIGQGEDHVMAFDVQDVVDLNCEQVTTSQNRARGQNGTATSFRTDVDISGNLALRQRDLQRWEPSEDTGVDLSLAAGDAAGWDQFAENKRLYGVSSNYNEELYTTKIDRSRPGYAKIAADAERKAREIEGSSAMNAHVAEERGVKSLDDSGLDEEEKYSGVRRDYTPLATGNPNSYTPPSRRPASDANANASTTLNDPAILAASPAKPSTPQSIKEEKLPPVKPATEPVKDKPVPAAIPKATAGEGQFKNGPAKDERKISETAKRNPDNATDTVERDVMDAFKQFANSEKAMVKNHQRDRLNKDKQMKINELRSFARNFKLNTPVPKDLVPILAKDEKKQIEIMEKAKQAAEDVKASPSKPPALGTSGSDPKVPRAISAQVPPSPVDRGAQSRRPGQDNRPPVSYNRGMPGSNVQRPGNLSQRLSNHRGMQMPQMPVPTPIQTGIPPTGQAGIHNGLQSPSSSAATRFNAGAREFRPNPAANTFSLGVNNTSTSSSPRHDNTRPVSKGLADLWDGKAPPSAEQHPPLTDFFNAIPRLIKEAESDPNKTKFGKNGGIPWAYSTPPSWNVPDGNINIKYAEMFEKLAPVSSIASPPHMIPQNGHVPHQHQLPPHLQQNGPMMPQGHTPHHTPRHMPAQPHHGQHFDDNQMRFSQSQSSVQPSPQPMPRYIMNGPNGPMMQPMAAYGMGMHGQPVAFRPVHGAVAPQFVAQHPGMVMGGQVMAQQPSNGPLVQMNPQMAMYQQSPGPGHVYPHQGGPMQGQMQMQGPPAGPNGYPSPRPPAPMMQQQGSQQGHMQGGPGQPMMFVNQGVPMYTNGPNGPMTPMRGHYGQPHQQMQYGTSPHQHYQQGPHRGTPSAQYAQPMAQQQQHHAMTPQGGPPAQQAPPAPVSAGDSAGAPDEGK